VAGLFAFTLVLHAATPRFITYLGGSGSEAASAVARDGAGNLYIAGSGDTNGFVWKLDPSGGKILASTTFPGTASALVLDGAGNVIVAGYTDENGFVSKFSPALDKPLFTKNLTVFPLALGQDAAGNLYLTGGDFTRGLSDAFVLKLSPDASTQIYKVTLGGSDTDVGHAISVDAAGNVAVAGETASSNFPLLNATHATFGGVISDFGSPDQGDAFTARIDAAGKLVYSTFLGGAGIDVAYAVALDGSGNAVVGGYTESPDPTGIGFVSKLSAQGALLWNRTIGGAGLDAVYALALDGGGSIYTTGATNSVDFPATGEAIPTCRTSTGPFIAEFDGASGNLIRSTKGPGLGFDIPYAITIDAAGGIYLAGSAGSRVFFATPGAAQTTFGGGSSDAFAMKIDWNATLGTYPACVLNAASFQAGNQTFFPTGAVAPSEIVSIFGAGLSGAAVTFDGLPADVFYSGPNQINAVVPAGLKNSTTQMTVGNAAPVSMPVNAAVPAIFTYQGGIGQVVAINDDDGTLNSPSNPAARGSYVTFYATGAGTQTIGATVRGVPATVQYGGQAPGFIDGLLQINVQVPTTVDFGNSLPLFLSAGPFSSQFGVTVAVK